MQCTESPPASLRNPNATLTSTQRATRHRSAQSTPTTSNLNGAGGGGGGSNSRKKLDPQSQFILNLVTDVMADFFAAADKNPLLFVESLFWRGTSDNVRLKNHYLEDHLVVNGRGGHRGKVRIRGGKPSIRL
jgi:hypothetical protein